MKADVSGRGVLRGLDALVQWRERWLLIVALISALIWARDLVESYAGLPAAIKRQAAVVSQLDWRVHGLEARLAHGHAGPHGDLAIGVRPSLTGRSGLAGTRDAVDHRCCRWTGEESAPWTLFVPFDH
ncbi:MAG: hypothetical protein AAFR79_07225 [Pseudomonadota bacterium]